MFITFNFNFHFGKSKRQFWRNFGLCKCYFYLVNILLIGVEDGIMINITDMLDQR